jgi:hypothetical protein
MSPEKFIVDNIFEVKSGNFHDTITLDAGDVPLVSCGDENQGFVGYFNIPKTKTYKNALTVAYNGAPLTTKFHPYNFAAKDDVAVLVPRIEMNSNTLLYIASILNGMKWRYNYGRKCFKAKLKRLRIPLPSIKTEKGKAIDFEFINNNFPSDISAVIPPITTTAKKNPTIDSWDAIPITKVFNLFRGNFHSIKDLDDGKFRTVSRVTTMNGTVGYFDKPDDATEYAEPCITISTVGGDAFVQLSNFIATDNVIMLVPKSPMALSSLYFIAFILNYQKWRYSYGRQCYLNKLKSTKLILPINSKGSLDEKMMQSSIENHGYWKAITESISVL